MKLPKVYEPNLYENDIYSLWERSEAFKPTGKGEPYAIVLPPPNANGNLHVGHALTNAVQDVAIRYHRLKGDNTLYLPGADHAGFETQVVYEKELAKQGKSRFDFGRDELYAQIYEFVDSNRGIFENQLRRLGGSFDWSRYTFTLDEKIVRRAYATFRKMWDEGLVYRGERLVNFCTFHGTAFADIEVAYKEERSKLWYLRYPLTDGSGEIVVATTRPETMFGDTGVAVHPEDARYKAFIGKTVKLPLTKREIPVIADSFVDPQFGTGAVKLTPAHDPNDFEAGQRHDLPKVSVIDEDGKMTAEVPEKYRRLTWQEARTTVVAELAEQGILLKDEDYLHKVGHCYKCDNIIQPLLREQWFVDMQPLAREAIKALKEKRITFYPDTKRTQLITYLEGLRDWNISRQIAWGIPIPAFQNVDDPADWIYDEHVTEELIQIDNKTYRRDPDVFDTWFSSGSWPYATLDFPDNDDFKTFYPLSLLETGFDIMAPWVSRMIMLGLYVTGEVPFKAVYLHGLVLDPHGQKMSKSKGNVVNPIDIIDQYGSDALRMGLLTGQTAGSNQPFTESKVIGARNFANKLWNISRYIEDVVGDVQLSENDAKPNSAADHWVLQRLQHTTENMSSLLDHYRFSEAYELLYHFVWDDFADWYIEASKSEPNKGMLAYCLENILILTHPFAPFVTETIWQTLAWEGDSILAKASWPTIEQHNSDEADNFAEIQKIVAEARYIKKALNVQGTTLYYTDIRFLAENAQLIKRLARLTDVTEVSDGTGLYLTDTRHRCWLDIDESTARGYQQQLGVKREAQEKVIAQLEGRLGNKSYVDNAPRNIVEQTRTQLQEAREQLESINKEYERFGN